MTTRPARYDERQGLNLGMHELNPVREGCLPVGMLPTSHVNEAGNKLGANQAPPGYLHAYSDGAGINFLFCFFVLLESSGQHMCDGVQSVLRGAVKRLSPHFQHRHHYHST